ncbi:phage tail tape measure protein [Streptomyces niveiscabiei]|uniref:phage tail tape measure protein n=1 Tax=Streptomyces niveiscabiei TaxID=164115 RepID=UPI0006EBCD09|nr:phage tail tape measure protein [Streptomyces niveiscabiei]
MVTRTVTVRLVGDVNRYTSSMRQAARQTSQLAGAGAAVGTALVAGFALAATAAAKFDKELSNVRAVTQANGAEMKKLRAAALEAGKTTSFTATEAARAEAELARAGVSTADIVGGALKGALALAAAGQVDLTEAAVVSAQAMNTFGLKGKDVTHVADLLAAGANKSAADVHGLAMSLRMGGLLAHQTGLSIEDTVGVLAAFADHALIGSDAGTSLKVMLQRLVPQSKEAKTMMEEIGFSAYDATGKFVGLEELSARMKTSFSKLTPEARNAAMATIFGADAVRSATILYELGADGITKYVDAVDDQGAAQRMAATQTDNLVGDLERLRGAIEVALIESGSAANDSLRAMTQWVTRLVNAYNDLPPSLQHAVTLFSGIGGAAALAAAGVLLLLPRIAATRTALASMGLTAARTRAILGTLGRVGIVVAGLELISYASEQVRKEFQDAPPSVSKMANSLVDLARTGNVGGEALSKLGSDLDGFGEAVQRVAHPDWKARTTDVVNSLTFGITEGLAETQIPLQEARDKIKAVDEALAQLAQSGNAQLASDAFTRLAGAAAADGTSKEKLLTLMPQYTDALANVDTQSKTNATSQAELAKQLGLTADELQDQRTEAEKLADSLNALNGVNIGAAQREISFRQSLADLTEAVKDNGRSLDVTSAKGRQVKSAFLDAASAAMEHAQAISEQKGSQEAGQKVLEKDISLLRQQMLTAGFAKDVVDDLLSSYLQMPVSTTTTVKADTKAAVADLEGVQQRLRETKGKSVTVNALTGQAEKALTDVGFKVTHMKDGRVSITIPTGPPTAAISAIQGAINSVTGRTIGIGVYRTEYLTTVRKSIPGVTPNAQGGLIRRADGGPVQFIPDGGPIVGPGTGTSDSIPALISNGEYVIKASSVRKYGVAMFDRLNAGHFASGGLLGGFTYEPSGQPVLGGPSDAKQRYDDLVNKLRDAWKEYQDALKERDKVLRDKKSTKKDRDAARKEAATAYAAVKSLDAQLGLRAGAPAPGAFNLAAYQKQLGISLKATEAWRSQLAKIGKRGGEEIRSLLEGMGEDGAALVAALAGASDKQFKDITAKLLKTGEFAKTTLADFTRQLGASTAQSKQFAADLQTLAARGFGSLAQALAAQGDTSAQALARQAVTGSPKDVAAANKTVEGAQGTLSGDDLADALTLLSTLRGAPGRGYADLIAAGLDVAAIRALVPKMTGQIKALPAAYKDTFVRQWVQQGGKAMARGGILTGPQMVLGGEAGVPESWIPWTPSARSRGLLAATASALGYQLVPAARYGSGRTGSTAPAQEVTRTVNVTLNGARQSTAEQAADIARHMAWVG